VALISFRGSPHGGSQRLLPEWRSQGRITPIAIIDHSIVGSAMGAWLLFRDSSGLESHFIVRGRRSGAQDGHIWQLMDTGRRADANRDANRYAISIETEDDGDPDTQPWTRAQLQSLAWLHNKLRSVHPSIPRRRSRSCSDPAGLGYHTLHGAPSCWTPVAKTCPGAVRKGQWRDVLLPAFLAGKTLEDEMPLDRADKDAIRGIVQAELEEFRRRRPANLSGDPDNKPLTLGEMAGAFPNAGVPGVHRQVDAIKGTLDAGVLVKLTPDQLTSLAEALAPLVAAKLEIEGIAEAVADELAQRLAQ
jgi:N-acetylmuramoyl-L-alanine amidase